MALHPHAFTDELAVLLDAAADDGTRAWWERYLKGAARFRGVKMADTRRAVRRLVAAHDLADADADTWFALSAACFAQPWSEDKLAGVLLLAEHGLATLRVDHVPGLASPLAGGLIADWNVCDWYGVKVLGPFVTAGDDVEARARAIAGWTTAGPVWQRRAAAVAFVDTAGTDELFDGFTTMLLQICATNAADPYRWSQTGVGWLLRELSQRRPDDVRAFVEAHPELSSEARRAATARLVSAASNGG